MGVYGDWQSPDKCYTLYRKATRRRDGNIATVFAAKTCDENRKSVVVASRLKCVTLYNMCNILCRIVFENCATWHKGARPHRPGCAEKLSVRLDLDPRDESTAEDAEERRAAKPIFFLCVPRRPCG